MAQVDTNIALRQSIIDRESVKHKQQMDSMIEESKEQDEVREIYWQLTIVYVQIDKKRNLEEVDEVFDRDVSDSYPSQAQQHSDHYCLIGRNIQLGALRLDD